MSSSASGNSMAYKRIAFKILPRSYIIKIQKPRSDLPLREAAALVAVHAVLNSFPIFMPIVDTSG